MTVPVERFRQAVSRIRTQITTEMRDLGGGPTELAAHAGQLSGIELLTRSMRGELPPPPAALPFGLEMLQVEPGRVTMALEPAEWMCNATASIHGGIAATLLDSVLGCAVHTTLPPATGYATTDLHVRYLRRMSPDTGRVIATATVTHPGTRYATAQGQINVEATEQLIATATAGCIILRPS